MSIPVESVDPTDKIVAAVILGNFRHARSLLPAAEELLKPAIVACSAKFGEKLIDLVIQNNRTGFCRILEFTKKQWCQESRELMLLDFHKKLLEMGQRAHAEGRQPAYMHFSTFAGLARFPGNSAKTTRLQYLEAVDDIPRLKGKPKTAGIDRSARVALYNQ